MNFKEIKINFISQQDLQMYILFTNYPHCGLYDIWNIQPTLALQVHCLYHIFPFLSKVLNWPHDRCASKNGTHKIHRGMTTSNLQEVSLAPQVHCHDHVFAFHSMIVWKLTVWQKWIIQIHYKTVAWHKWVVLTYRFIIFLKLYFLFTF